MYIGCDELSNINNSLKQWRKCLLKQHNALYQPMADNKIVLTDGSS